VCQYVYTEQKRWRLSVENERVEEGREGGEEYRKREQYG